MRIFKAAVLPMAVLLFAAATAAADRTDNRSQGKSAQARAVAPGQVKKLHVTAFDGKIAPSVLRVRKGEKVRITFVSKDATYGIKFKDFDVSAKVSPQNPAVVEFTPTQKGTFEFRCTKIMNLKKWAQNGTLIVN